MIRHYRMLHRLLLAMSPFSKWLAPTPPAHHLINLIYSFTLPNHSGSRCGRNWTCFHCFDSTPDVPPLLAQPSQLDWIKTFFFSLHSLHDARRVELVEWWPATWRRDKVVVQQSFSLWNYGPSTFTSLRRQRILFLRLMHTYYTPYYLHMLRFFVTVLPVKKTDFGGFELGVRVLQYVRSPALCKNCVNWIGMMHYHLRGEERGRGFVRA